MGNTRTIQFGIFLFMSICAIVFFVGTAPLHVAAQVSRSDELKQSITAREDEIKKLEDEITEYQVRLDNVGSQKTTLQTAVQSIDLSRAKLSKDIQLTQKKIDRSSLTIRELDVNIAHKEAKIRKNHDVIAEIIIRIAESDSSSMLEILLSSDSISTFLEDVDDLTKLQAAIRDSIKSLEGLKSELEENLGKHQTEKKGLLSLNTRIADQKVIADQERRSQAALLSVTKNQESNYRKLLADRQARKQQFEREIDDFEAQLRAEIDLNSFPPRGTKVLAYPLEKIAVTQRFGKTIDAVRLYASGSHNGMDMRASPGTPLRAAGDGVVVATGDTDRVCPWASYGKWILIKHKNGLSTIYAHLELIKVAAGREVRVGDLIGYTGNSGYSTGPHLHFGAYVSSVVSVSEFPSKSCKGAVFKIPVAPANGYLDPEDYL